MSNFIRVLVLALVTFSFINVSASENKTADREVKTTSVQGKVIDKFTGETLAGVAIKFEGYNVIYSDFDGNFELSGVEPGKYSLSTNYISYKEVCKEVEIELRKKYGFKQYELTGGEVSRNFISMVENGKANLTMRTAEVIARKANNILKNRNMNDIITAYELLESVESQIDKMAEDYLELLERDDIKETDIQSCIANMIGCLSGGDD